MILRPIVVTAEQGGTVRTAVKVEQRLEIVLEGSALDRALPPVLPSAVGSVTLNHCAALVSGVMDIMLRDVCA